MGMRRLAELYPNQVGEILRGEFFHAHKFEFKDTVTNRSSMVVPKDSEEGNGEADYTLFSASLNIEGEEVKCEWYWDEDYFLAFEFDDGTCLSNSDAKKDHRWMFESEDYVPKS